MEGAPYNRQKTPSCMCECACVRVYVKGIPFLNQKYLSSQFSSLWKYFFWNRSKISSLLIHTCFSILGFGKPFHLPCQNFGVLEVPRGICTRAKCERAVQSRINIRGISLFFVCWGYGLTTKKLLKVIWRKLRQRFIMDTKNNLNWNFLLIAKAKIPFGKHRFKIDHQRFSV